MHICVFSLKGISLSVSPWGGVNTHAKNLADILLNSGHTVSVVTSEGESYSGESLRIFPIYGNQGGRPTSAWAKKAADIFLKINRKQPVDCVFSEGDTARPLINIIAGSDIPVVAFVHLLSMHYFYNIWQEVDGLRPLKSYFFRTLPRIIHDIIVMDIAFLSRCDMIVTGSIRIAEDMTRYYRLPIEKIRTIHNWVEPKNFMQNLQNKYDFRKTLNLKDNDLIFLLIGSLWRPKGFRVALKAFHKASSVLPNAFLLISGDGNDRKYIENYIRKHPDIQKRVILLGLVPHNQLSDVFLSSDIFIIPSIMDEVLPYTLLEAMFFCLPIIATDIPANREALGPGHDLIPKGRIAPLIKIMLHYASTLERRKLDAIQHKTRVLEKFSVKTASIKIESLLKELF